MKKLIQVFTILLMLTGGSALAEDCSHYFSVVRSTTGNAVSGATVSVYLANTVTPVSVFSDSGCSIPKSNPFLTNSQGNYDFFVQPGVYKVVATKVGVGTFTQDYIFVGTQIHASNHESGGADEVSLGNLTGEVISSQIDDGTIVNDDISGTAAIDESKLSLNFPTHVNTNDPSSDQKAALAGTAGLPSAANKYVTNLDSRLSDSRSPTAHAPSHAQAGSDPVTVSVSQLSGVDAGTDLAADLEEETHVSEHQNGGSDEISVAGLSGQLADPQPVTLSLNGSDVSSRTKINLIEGTDIDLTVADNPGDSRVDVTVTSVASGAGSGAPIEVYDGAAPIVVDLTRMTFAGGDFAVTDGGSGNAQVSIVNDKYSTILDEGVAVTQRAAVNFIGASVGCVDNVGSSSTDCTFTDGGADSHGDLSNLEVDDHSQYLLLSGRPGGQLVYGGPSDEDGFVLRSNSTQMLPELIFEVSDVGGGTYQYDAGLYGAPSTASGISVRSISDGSFYPRVRITGNIVFDFGSGHVPKGAMDGLNGRFISDGGYSLGTWDVADLTDVSGLACVYVDSDRWYQDKDCDQVKDVGENYLDEPAASVGDADYGDIEVSGSGTSWLIGTNVVNDTHIDWGTGANQVNTDDVTEGTTNKFIVATQKTDLTDGGDTGLHFHSSDRDLSNATGALDPTLIGNGITDAQVLDDLTISSSGDIDAAAIKTGIIPVARFGVVATDFKAVIIPYPSDLSSSPGFPKTVGSIYFPVDATIDTIAGRVVGASQTCDINVKKDSTNALVSNLTVDLDGNSTSVISSASIGAGKWVGFVVDNCGTSLTELTITLVYKVN